MKEIIDGNFRITPLKVRTHVDRNSGIVQYWPWEIWQNIKWAKFEYQWKEYTTNLFGIYWPQFRDAMFPEDTIFSWYKLQKRQREYNISRWLTTIVFAPRWWGKSWLNGYNVAMYLFKEIITSAEKSRPFVIHYYWLSKSLNRTIVEYVKNMVLKLHDSKFVVKWKNTDQELILFDGKVERRIMFLSQWQEWWGWLGMRPHKVVLDEAARLSKDTYSVASGTAGTEIDIITTVNHQDKKNWVFDMYKEALKKQRDYKNVFELIAEIWIKYGLHLLKNSDELMAKVQDGTMAQVKQDYYQQRPIVWLKYAITDIEYLTEAQKQEQIDKYMLIWEDYCLAELFSEYADDTALFNTEWLVEWEIPKQFEAIAYGYDEADEFDNPAMTFVWLRWSTAYVLYSEKLPKDLIARRERLKELSTRYAEMADNKRCITGWDMTRTLSMWVREFEDNVWVLDYALKYTWGNNAKRDRPYWVVWKQYFVNLLKDEFFMKNNIRFWPWLDWDGGLLDELSKFKRKSNGKYEASKWKDDQVNALMIAIFVLYKTHVEWNVSYLNRLQWMTLDERLEASNQKRIEKEDYERYVMNTATIIADFW